MFWNHVFNNLNTIFKKLNFMFFVIRLNVMFIILQIVNVAHSGFQYSESGTSNDCAPIFFTPAALTV